MRFQISFPELIVSTAALQTESHTYRLFSIQTARIDSLLVKDKIYRSLYNMNKKVDVLQNLIKSTVTNYYPFKLL